MHNNPETPNTTPEQTPHQRAVNLAWQAEGLDGLLNDAHSPELAQKVTNAVMTALTLKEGDDLSANAVADFLEETLKEYGQYNSGIRKYPDEEPIHEGKA